MKLEIFDAYNIRARFSVSIILLSPIILALFLCFDKVFSTVSSAVFVLILLAFANYLPILQRAIGSKQKLLTDYAAEFLSPTDSTFDPVTKVRYYKKLATLDPSFASLTDCDNPSQNSLLNSAISFLREKTRGNRLVLEENITYGFCKNLQAAKYFGIAICVLTGGGLFVYSKITNAPISATPLRVWFTLAVIGIILLFWFVGVRKNLREAAAKRYAKALIMAIDSL